MASLRSLKHFQAEFGLWLFNLEENRAMSETDIFKAARNGNLHEVRMLVGSGVSVNSQNPSDNETPLHVASAQGNMTMIEYLISRGADVNAVSESGWTVLHNAAEGFHHNAIQLLISKRANINAKNHIDATPLDLAVTNTFADKSLKPGAVQLLLEAGSQRSNSRLGP